MTMIKFLIKKKFLQAKRFFHILSHDKVSKVRGSSKHPLGHSIPRTLIECLLCAWCLPEGSGGCAEHAQAPRDGKHAAREQGHRVH